jgi:hypothetical protein
MPKMPRAPEMPKGRDSNKDFDDLFVAFAALSAALALTLC